MLNKKVLMSGADFFSVKELNPYENDSDQPDLGKAKAEHAAVKQALESAGVEVIQVAAPESCQDGVYTANWALVHGNKAVLSSLPNARKAEEPYAKQVLESLDIETIGVPEGLKFSGQGDALPIGGFLLCGSNYRSDPEAQKFAAEQLGFERVQLQTIPALDTNGQPIINKVSGWPDSYFYDIDLAISILREDLIAWCPAAFTPESQAKIRELPLDKIEVSLEEAKEQYACNLVSTSETVIMSASAPELKAAIEAKGLKTITPKITELAKGGGYIRCTSLAIS